MGLCSVPPPPHPHWRQAGPTVPTSISQAAGLPAKFSKVSAENTSIAVGSACQANSPICVRITQPRIHTHTCWLPEGMTLGWTAPCHPALHSPSRARIRCPGSWPLAAWLAARWCLWSPWRGSCRGVSRPEAEPIEGSGHIQGAWGCLLGAEGRPRARLVHPDGGSPHPQVQPQGSLVSTSVSLFVS